MTEQTPNSTRDLFPSERHFLRAMHLLRFGHFKSLQIRDGELILNPAPVAVRQLKFGTTASPSLWPAENEFELKHTVAEFFRHVRSIRQGEIRLLQISNGLPMLAEEEYRVVLCAGTAADTG